MPDRQSTPTIDVTNTERALRVSEERYALVTEATSDGIYDWDVQTNRLEVSARLNEIVGLAQGELTSENWADRVHPDDLSTYRDAIICHFKAETPKLACEYRLRRKSLDYIWVSDQGVCVRDEAGRAIRLVGAFTDIASRKLAELGLRCDRIDFRGHRAVRSRRSRDHLQRQLPTIFYRRRRR